MLLSATFLSRIPLAGGVAGELLPAFKVPLAGSLALLAIPCYSLSAAGWASLFIAPLPALLVNTTGNSMTLIIVQAQLSWVSQKTNFANFNLCSQLQRNIYEVSVSPIWILRQPAKVGGKCNERDMNENLVNIFLELTPSRKIMYWARNCNRFGEICYCCS